MTIGELGELCLIAFVTIIGGRLLGFFWKLHEGVDYTSTEDDEH